MSGETARMASPQKAYVRPYLFDVLDGLKENKRAVLGGSIVLALALMAIFAPLIAPNDPIEQHNGKYLLPPSPEFPLGTDELGRCIFSRLIYGTQISLQVGVMVVAITAAFGTLAGLIAGYFGGLADEVIMRAVDVLLAFPGLILSLVIAGLLGPGRFNVMLALSAVGWTVYARMVRGCVLATKERAFVESARALGGNGAHIMSRHILPEVLSPVIVMATLAMGGTILSSASLGFLGLGAQAPAPEWGTMLNDGRAYMQLAPHVMVFPGIAIMLTVIAFNFLGDGLRDVLDTKNKKKLEV
jgi:peptide/nickel transport system permease protein